jgi:hypothetical protein
MGSSAFAGRHLCDSAEWYTPLPYIDAAREVMGGIDLDPASHEEANRVIQATHYYTELENGLMQEWKGRIFINPPIGLVNAFWHKLLIERGQHCTEAVWIGYSLEQLQTLQNADATKTPLDFPLCIPNRRIAFVENEAKKVARLAKLRTENERRVQHGEKPRPIAKSGSPSHGNYICYLGPNVDRFSAVFSRFGAVMNLALERIAEAA